MFLGVRLGITNSILYIWNEFKTRTMEYDTPKQRKKVYEKLINTIKSSEYWLGFMCNELDHLTEYTIPTGEIFNVFTELWEQRPIGIKYKEDAWYADSRAFEAVRIKALKAAIKLCETK